MEDESSFFQQIWFKRKIIIQIRIVESDPETRFIALIINLAHTVCTRSLDPINYIKWVKTSWIQVQGVLSCHDSLHTDLESGSGKLIFPSRPSWRDIT